MGVLARTAVKTIVKIEVATSAGEDRALARTLGTPANAASVTDLLWDPGGTRRVTVSALAQISLAKTTEVAVTGAGKKNTQIALQNPLLHPDHPRLYNFLLPLSQDHSISRILQYIVRPQANTRPKNPSTRLSEVSFRPSHREGVNSNYHASLDTKGLMKLPSIPFDIADGNVKINLVDFTASLKEAVVQMRDLVEDFSEGDFWISGWHKPLMRHVLNSVSHHHPG